MGLRVKPRLRSKMGEAPYPEKGGRVEKRGFTCPKKIAVMRKAPER
jgi:hypothetical protein